MTNQHLSSLTKAQSDAVWALVEQHDCQWDYLNRWKPQTAVHVDIADHNYRITPDGKTQDITEHLLAQ